MDFPLPLCGGGSGRGWRRLLVTSIPLLDQRKRAVDVRRDDRRRGVDEAAVELAETGDAEEPQRDDDLPLEQLEDAGDTLGAGGGEAVAIEPADRDEVGAH